MTQRNGWIVATLVLCLAHAAQAQQAPAPEETWGFPKGQWTAQTYLSGVLGDSEPIASGAVGIGYFPWNNVSLNADVYGYGIFNNAPDTAATGFQLQLRNHHFHGDRWTIFSDVGEGVFEAFENDVPRDGTRLNFTFRTGLGGTYQLRDNLYLIGGVHYFHLSNAQIEGHERNPNINGVEGYVGLMWTLGR
jgi:hypothetical protein